MRVVVLAVALVLSGCGMEGEPGPQGPAGPAGPAGDQGPPGPSQVLASFVACSTTVSIASSTISLIHQRYEFSDGGVSTGCEVRDDIYGYRGGYAFLPGQQGAALGLCHVSYDVDTPSFGRWEFVINAGASSAVYRDPGGAYDGRVFPLTCASFP